MSSENGIQEVEAEFDAILQRLLTRRGKQRKKHIEKLKEFMHNILILKKEVTDQHKLLEIGNLELEIRSLRREKRQLEDALRKRKDSQAQSGCESLKKPF